MTLAYIFYRKLELVIVKNVGDLNKELVQDAKQITIASYLLSSIAAGPGIDHLRGHLPLSITGVR